MRIPFLLLFILPPATSFAQPALCEQLHRILAATGNEFREIREANPILTSTTDTSFAATLQLEGTQENRVSKADSALWFFGATLSGPAAAGRSRKVCDEWKEKLRACLGPSFGLEGYTPVSYNPSRYGWRFFDGTVRVALDVMPAGATGKFRAVISVY